MTKERPTRIPTAKEILSDIEILNSGVIISKVDQGWLPHQTTAFEQMYQSPIGAEVATYITTPLKMVAQPFTDMGGGNIEKLPPYKHTCLPIDQMLFGAYPNTRYFDVSRGGPLAAIDRSSGYLARGLHQYSENTDKVTKDWIIKYGLGAVVPLIRRKKLFQWVKDNNAEAYLVPATSAAEGVVATSNFFPKMRKALDRIKGQIPWLTEEWRRNNKGSSRLYEVLYTYILEQFGRLKLARMLSGEEGSLEEVAELFMKMAKKLFFLGKEPDEIYKAFAERLYDPNQIYSHPHYGAQADCSEVVIKSDKQLSTIPWEAMLLLGDGKTTKEQLINMANLLKELYPNTEVIILLNNEDKPLEMGDNGQNHLTRLAIAAWTDKLLRKKVIQDYKFDISRVYKES
ncbi:MAG: hypothetical protein AAB437_03505 [Patescibacteria group bacterium]